MALSRIKIWGAEVLTAADLNAEFNNIINNATSLISPLGAALNWSGYAHILDAAGVTTAQSTAAVAWTFSPGSKTGTPGTTGGIQNWAASTWTDNNTGGSGTAAAWVGHALQRPTLAASNSSVTTTDAATAYIANSPLAGSNETITNAWALWVDAGQVRIDEGLGGIGAPVVNELRLTLTSGTPVTTSDVTAAGTLYLTPYTGTHISLYSGSQWHTLSTAEVSLALSLTSGKPFDVWAYNNAGTVTLETLVWTNDTTRATALAYQNGVLVKSGDATRRYLGSIYSSGANITEDSAAKRYVYNYYNRVPRKMVVTDAVDSWTYTTATWRQARGSTANQLDCMLGVLESAVSVMVHGFSSNASGVFVATGIGIDSTTTNSADTFGSIASAAGSEAIAIYNGLPSAAGRHTFVWLEISTATGTTTWYGDQGLSYFLSGITGVVDA